MNLVFLTEFCEVYLTSQTRFLINIEVKMYQTV